MLNWDSVNRAQDSDCIFNFYRYFQNFKAHFPPKKMTRPSDAWKRWLTPKFLTSLNKNMLCMPKLWNLNMEPCLGSLSKEYTRANSNSDHSNLRLTQRKFKILLLWVYFRCILKPLNLYHSFSSIRLIPTFCLAPTQPTRKRAAAEVRYIRFAAPRALKIWSLQRVNSDTIWSGAMLRSERHYGWFVVPRRRVV